MLAALDVADEACTQRLSILKHAERDASAKNSDSNHPVSAVPHPRGLSRSGTGAGAQQWSVGLTCWRRYLA